MQDVPNIQDQQMQDVPDVQDQQMQDVRYVLRSLVSVCAQMQDVPGVCKYLKKRFPKLFVLKQAWIESFQLHGPWLDVMDATLRRFCPNKQVDSSEIVLLTDGHCEMTLDMIVYTYLHALKNFPVRPFDKITTLCIVKPSNVKGDFNDYIGYVSKTVGKVVNVETITIGEFVIEISTW